MEGGRGGIEKKGEEEEKGWKGEGMERRRKEKEKKNRVKRKPQEMCKRKECRATKGKSEAGLGEKTAGANVIWN